MRLDVTLIADGYFRNGVLLATKTRTDRAKNGENMIMKENSERNRQVDFK